MKKYRKYRPFYLSFFEFFSIIIVFSSISSFYLTERFSSGIINKIGTLFYIVLLFGLLYIIIFRFRGSNVLFIVILILFAFFYTLSCYMQNDEVPRNYSDFSAYVSGNIEYKNNRSNFEGVLFINPEDIKKRWNISGKKGIKVIFKTDSIYPEVVKGSIIKGKGMISLLNRKKSEYNLNLFSKGIDYIMDVSDIEVERLTKPTIFFNQVYALKRYIERICDKILPYPHSTLVTALLTGNRKQVPSYLTSIFKRAGTLHILAISGLHLGFIAGIFIIIFMLVGFRHVALYVMVSIFIVLFALFIGDSPSVKRASMMFIIGILLYVLDRDRDYINLLAVVFFILMMLNPRSAYNPGFLLSFFATFGIVFFSPEIKGILEKFLPLILSTLISLSIAASIYTFPVMIVYFGRFPYISVIANIFIIPLTALILSISLLMVAAYPVFLPMAILIAHLNSFFISLLFFINIGFSFVPPISFNFNIMSNVWIFAFFGIVTFLIYYFIKRRVEIDRMS